MIGKYLLNKYNATTSATVNSTKKIVSNILPKYVLFAKRFVYYKFCPFEATLGIFSDQYFLKHLTITSLSLIIHVCWESG